MSKQAKNIFIREMLRWQSVTCQAAKASRRQQIHGRAKIAAKKCLRSVLQYPHRTENFTWQMQLKQCNPTHSGIACLHGCSLRRSCFTKNRCSHKIPRGFWKSPAVKSCHDQYFVQNNAKDCSVPHRARQLFRDFVTSLSSPHCADPGQAHLGGPEQRGQADCAAWLCPSSACPSTDGAGAQEVTSGAAAKSANISIDWFSLSHTQPQISFLAPLTSLSQQLCGDAPSSSMQFESSQGHQAAQTHPELGHPAAAGRGVCKGSPCSSSRCLFPVMLSSSLALLGRSQSLAQVPTVLYSQPWQQESQPKAASFVQLELKVCTSNNDHSIPRKGLTQTKQWIELSQMG